MTRIVVIFGALTVAASSLFSLPSAHASTVLHAEPPDPAPLLALDVPAGRPTLAPTALSPAGWRPAPAPSPARPAWGALLRAADHR